MYICRKKSIASPPVTSHGEVISELIGRFTGHPTERHSVAYVVLPPGKSTLRHYHPTAEESYYLLCGQGEISIGDERTAARQGDIVLIPPMQPHKLTNTNTDQLEFLVICVPAWESTNTVWLEGPDARKI